MCELSDEEILNLERTALRIRKKILAMMEVGKEGHIGGALSCVDILTCLFFKIMRIDVRNPRWRERDRFILSAGHKCLALYATLAERNFFDSSLLNTYNSLGSSLPAHPDMNRLPGVESNTGSMGHGLSIAGGMAMAAKMDNLDYKVFVITGDGELAEGSIWEAAAACSHHGLDNLLVFVDRNRLQIGGPTSEIMNYEPLATRWDAFGWSVREINGHNMSEIVKNAAHVPFSKGKPSVIIANTVKGKGFRFAENKASYHYWRATKEEIEMARNDLAEAGRTLGI